MRLVASRCALVLLLAAGCATAPAVSGAFRLDRESGQKCRAHCESLDMRLGAVVIVMNSTGCVCEPKDLPRGAREGAAGTGAVAATIVLQQEQQQRQQSASQN